MKKNEGQVFQKKDNIINSHEDAHKHFLIEINDKAEAKAKPTRSDSGGYALTEASTHSEKITKQKV